MPQRRHRLHRALDTRQRGQVLKAVSDRLGLVHFGSIGHGSDEHELIGGLTVSTTHRDRYYAVGSHEGYDLSVVDRRDAIRVARGKKEHHNWVIVQIALPQVKEMPHVFMLPSSRDDRFLHLFAGARHLSPLETFYMTDFQQEFNQRYTVYATPRASLAAYEVLNRSLTNGISAHFWPHAIEWHRGHLYIYITEHRLTETVLLGAIQSALWLADMLDQRFA